MAIKDTLELRALIRKHLRPHRDLTKEQVAALDLWIRDRGAPLVLRHLRHDLVATPALVLTFTRGVGEDEGASRMNFEAPEEPLEPWMTSMVLANVICNRFDISGSVGFRSNVGSSPFGALQAASAITDGAVWCMEMAHALELAALRAGVPSHVHTGASGLSTYMTDKRLCPANPQPFED